MLCTLTLSVYAQKQKVSVYFLEDDFCQASNVSGISPNGKYVVGQSGDLFHTSFIWDMDSRKAVQIIGSEDSLAVVYGVSDEGVVAGTFQDPETLALDGMSSQVPGTWKNGEWSSLPLMAGVPVSGSWLDGFACAISPDGKTVGGTIQHKYGKYTPALWIDGVLQTTEFEDTDFGQGAYCYSMSDDAKVLGGWAEHDNGSRSPSIWIENKIKRLIGETEDEVYFFDGQVRSVSRNGKYAAGYFSLNGTGSDAYPFVWSEETGVIKYAESGIASVVSNSGNVYGANGYMGNGMIYKDGVQQSLSTYLEENYDFDSSKLKYTLGTVMAISDDESVIGGWTIGGMVGGMPLMMPYIVIIEGGLSGIESTETAAPDVRFFSNELSISGEFESASVYNSFGTKVLSGINSNRTDVSGLEKGVYFVKVANGSKYTTFKVAK